MISLITFSSYIINISFSRRDDGSAAFFRLYFIFFKLQTFHTGAFVQIGKVQLILGIAYMRLVT